MPGWILPSCFQIWLGIKTGLTSLLIFPLIPTMASQLRSASVTSSWVALTALSGKNVSILNKTGADLLIRKAAETTAGFVVTVPDGGSVGIALVSNVSEVEISAAGAGPTAGVSYIVE